MKKDKKEYNFWLNVAIKTHKQHNVGCLIESKILNQTILILYS